MSTEPSPDLPLLPAIRSGTVIGLGTDIVEVDRIRQAYESHTERFLSRVFTEEEQRYCMGMKNPFPHLAARFAAKEAVSKAFGTGICGLFEWKSVSIRKGERGEPHAQLDEKAQRLLASIGGTNVIVSLSHTKVHAQATAIIIKAS